MGVHWIIIWGEIESNKAHLPNLIPSHPLRGIVKVGTGSTLPEDAETQDVYPGLFIRVPKLD